MSSRRQRTKLSTSFISEKSIVKEIFETQSQLEIWISIRTVFEKRSFSSQFTVREV